METGEIPGRGYCAEEPGTCDIVDWRQFSYLDSHRQTIQLGMVHNALIDMVLVLVVLVGLLILGRYKRCISKKS